MSSDTCKEDSLTAVNDNGGDDDNGGDNEACLEHEL